MCVHLCECVCVHVTVFTQESSQQKSVSESPCESESQMVMSYCSSAQCLSPSPAPAFQSGGEQFSSISHSLPCCLTIGPKSWTETSQSVSQDDLGCL